MTPRGTLGLCCVHIAQLMSHLAVYTLSFTLQLCYKPLRILQRVTKSQKVHISSYDVLQISHTCEEVEAHLRISFWHLLMSFEKPKKSEFWKNEKKKVISILHVCTKNHNHMRHSSWDTKNEKMKISKKLKKPLEIPHYIIVPKIMIIGYIVPEIWHVTDVIVIFYFGLFFALLPL